MEKVDYENLSSLTFEEVLNLFEDNSVRMYRANGDSWTRYKEQRSKCYNELLKRNKA